MCLPEASNATGNSMDILTEEDMAHKVRTESGCSWCVLRAVSISPVIFRASVLDVSSHFPRAPCRFQLDTELLPSIDVLAATILAIKLSEAMNRFIITVLCLQETFSDLQSTACIYYLLGLSRIMTSIFLLVAQSYYWRSMSF